MEYQFTSKRIPSDADFYVCCLDTNLQPCNKYDGLLLKKLKKYNKESSGSIEDLIRLSIDEKDLQPLNCLETLSLCNGKGERAYVMFFCSPVPRIFLNDGNLMMQADKDLIHKIYSLILQKSEAIGSKKMCIPLFGCREDIPVDTCFSIFHEHLRQYNHMSKNRSHLKTIYIVVDQKKASTEVDQIIKKIQSKRQSQRMLEDVRTLGVMNSKFYEQPSFYQ